MALEEGRAVCMVVGRGMVVGGLVEVIGFVGELVWVLACGFIVFFIFNF